MGPVVTIIIRSTGRPELADALESIAGQTYGNIEVVLVDVSGRGFSPEGGRCGKFPLRVVSQGRHLNRGAAANAGLDAATGDLVAFLDDDDWYLPGHVEVLAAAVLANDGVGAAYGGIECRRQGESGDWQVLHVFNEPYDPTRLLLENYLPMHSVLFRRTLLGPQLRFDESLRVYEDWDFWIQLSLVTPLLHVDRITAIYRISETSGFGIRRDDPEAGPGCAELLEKWRMRWTSEQLVAIAQYPGRKIGKVQEHAREAIARQDSLIARLQQRVADLEGLVEGMAGQQKPAPAASSRTAKAAALRERLWEAEEQRRSVASRLNVIQSSAVWQLASRLFNLEQRAPRMTRALLAVPKLIGWTLSFKLVSRLRHHRHARRLLASGLFDEAWYIERYPEVLLKGYRPIIHWVIHGWREGKNPSPLFLTSWYLEQNPALVAGEVNPLLHYLDGGAGVGCDPNPLFDSLWYLARNPEVAQSGQNPLAHYAAAGAAHGCEPNPLFDSAAYRQAHPEIAWDELTPLAHFLHHALSQGNVRLRSCQESDPSCAQAAIHARLA